MHETIYACFVDADTATKAVGALLDHGVRPNDISVLVKDGQNPTATLEGEPQKSAEHGITVTTAADAGAGAAKGTGVGLGVGVLAALAAVAIPGVGLVLGGGALAIALAGVAGAGVAGAVAGGITGLLKDQGVSEGQALHYNDRILAGGSLVSVYTPSNDVTAETVMAIFAKYGSNDLDHTRVANPVPPPIDYQDRPRVSGPV